MVEQTSNKRFEDALADLQRAIAEAEHRRDLVAQAEDEAKAAKAEVNRAVLRLGGVMAALEMPSDLALLRELYWQHPVVDAQAIAQAFGMRSGADVHRVVGPDTRPWPCRGGCGRQVVRNRKSRTGDVHLRGSRDDRLCQPCREALAAEELIKAREWAARQAEEREAHEQEMRLLRAAVRGGLQPIETYVRFPGFRGSFNAEDFDEPAS